MTTPACAGEPEDSIALAAKEVLGEASLEVPASRALMPINEIATTATKAAPMSMLVGCMWRCIKKVSAITTTNTMAQSASIQLLTASGSAKARKSWRTNVLASELALLAATVAGATSVEAPSTCALEGLEAIETVTGAEDVAVVGTVATAVVGTETTLASLAAIGLVIAAPPSGAAKYCTT